MPHERVDDIYGILLEMQRSHGKLEAKLEAVDEKVDSVLEQTTKTNGRVTRLEHWRIAVVAVSGVVGGAATWVYQWFTSKP
jgi:hypothetical protein